MKPLSKAKKGRIIDLLLAGKTYREVATIEGVSTSTVSKVFQEFVSVAEDRSITEVAAEYNVRDRVDRLIELSQEARKAKTPIPRLLSAVRLVSFMNSLDLRPSQLKNYLKMCDRHKGDFADFAAKATEFFELETKTGKPYERIVKEYSELIEKTASKREEIAELRIEGRRAKTDLERELTSNNLIRKDIPYASTLKETLSKYDIPVVDTNKIPRFLREIEACRGDPKVFLARAEEANTLDFEIHSLKREKGDLELAVEGLKDKVVQLQNEVDDLKATKKGLSVDVGEMQIKLEALKKEADERNLELRLLDCLTELLMSEPPDVDLLYTYSYHLKQIKNGMTPEQIPYKPLYEEGARKILLNAFLKYFGKDLAPKKKVTELKQKLQDQENQIETLLEEKKQWEEEREKLSTRNTELEKLVERLEKELQECHDQILRDPTIQPKDRKPPFSPY